MRSRFKQFSVEIIHINEHIKNGLTLLFRKKDKEGHHVMVTESIQQKYVTIVSVYASAARALGSLNINDLKWGSMGCNTIMMDFNT